MIVKCVTCGKEFKTWKAVISNGDGRFCSRKCYGEWRSKNCIGENHSRWKGGLLTRKCKECDNSMLAKPSLLKTNRNQFCSRSCYAIWMSKNRRREQVPSWKGGITEKTRLIRNSLKYINWRKEVFKRDRWTCIKCGIKGKKIHAHHIKNFKIIIEDISNKFPLFNEVDVYLGYTPLWDLNNGITLCTDCHKKEHIRRKQNGIN